MKPIAILPIGLSILLSGCDLSSPVEPAPNPAPMSTTLGSGTAVAKPTASQNLLQFAETAQNVVQTANTGLAILAPMVNTGAQIAGLVVDSPQKQAILTKIETASQAVSTAAVNANLPPPVVQAAVSSVNTPAAAVAIVTAVQNSTSTNP